jgi:hypothetical protein
MIFEVDFGTTQTGIGYRFFDRNGAFVGPRITAGINPGPQSGSYTVDATVPAGAVGIYWDCDDPLFTAQEPITPPLPTGTLSSTYAGIRRQVPFQRTLDAILRRLGIEPNPDNYSNGVVRSVCDHINNRVLTAWRYWDWPETMALEQRAFRPKWQPATDYAAGTELYYDATGQYYSALIDTTGQLPTDPAAFAPLQITDRFIPLDGVGDTPIDEVYGVFTANPRTARCSARSLRYQPSELGIDIFGAGATVWIHFRIRPPQFTVVTHVSGSAVVVGPTAPTGKTYNAGDIVFWPDPMGRDGDCYVALVDGIYNSEDPSIEPGWAKVPMLEIFHQYVVAGAYGDYLLDSIAADSTSQRPDLAVQSRLSKASAALAEAQEHLYKQIDRLMAQGEHYNYYAGPYTRPGIRFPTTSYVNVAA